ncbi:primosomal protein N' [Telmatospirillum siberiense]|uniref:Replication restart protein PriA n=1 Tax=Telmatospirillum siberiense TaxID=382514 RepID=A0A2N3PY49_9PROT|nr:primosomal protein N' [Telmatospirillum siberiense]PKU25350.1 primosomal protein N' [Telmatospirillum siberiense]
MLFPTANSQAQIPPASFQPGEAVAILLPLPLAGSYDYTVGPGQRLAAGDFVRVPLGGRTVCGVVWGAGSGLVPVEKRRAVEECLDLPPLPEESRKLVDWVAAYTVSPLGAVLRMVMSVPAALDPPPADPVAYVAAPPPASLKMTEARRRVLEAAGQPLPAAELARLAGVGASVVKGLADAGALTRLVMPRRTPGALSDWRREGFPLSSDQAAAAAHLRAKLSGGFSVTLLEGVTGSGKTEVYFEAVAAALEQGRQILVLLPEIALSAQWLARFERRFGAPPLEWHSELGQAQRRSSWRAVAEGRTRVVVGARSALFLPYPDLGLIIVDEEHDSSFKQEEGVIYHARDMAVVRARLGGLPIVLASATPSLETQTNVEAGRYERVHLPLRHGGADMPDLAVIDMRRHAPPRQTWLSAPLVAAVEESLAAGEQAMLFLNRRGYAPLTLCRGCGLRLQCPHCTAWLVEHRHAGRLQCHHCGYISSKPPVCPQCQAEDSFAACGPGVERLAEEVAAKFPDARVRIMASDTLSGPRATAELIASMERREIDLLIGTQVVAKGHHFPLLTLVGVVDADLGLAGGDLRAAERTFQLLCQVAGRAGRAARKGRVLLQTYQPDDKVMRALVSGDAEEFYRAEADDRRIAGMPPFGKLVALIVSGPDPDQVDRVAQQLARLAPRDGGIEVLGPAPAPLALLRGRHRRRLLLKASRSTKVQGVIRQWLGRLGPQSAVRIQIDVDPYSFV